MKIFKEEKEEIIVPVWVSYIIYVVVIILFVVMAQFITYKMKNDVAVDSLEYCNQNSINYKVYYEENPFYTEPYIPENKTYVSSYVKLIDVDFTSLVNYTEKLSGTYDYYINAKLVAYTPGDETDDLWNKEYKLTDVDTIDFDQSNSYRIDKNMQIDFQKYLQEYEEYRSSSKIASNAKLVIELVVNNHGEYKKQDKLDFTSSSKLVIPISDSTFQITKDVVSECKTLENKGDSKNKNIYMFIIIVCWLMVLVTVILLISLYVKNMKKTNAYEKKIKKILNTYDAIIVNVEKLPALTGLSVIDVTSFEELVDAQNEVRLPINFKEDKRRRTAKFVLVRNNLAWVYTLKEEKEIEIKEKK